MRSMVTTYSIAQQPCFLLLAVRSPLTIVDSFVTSFVPGGKSVRVVRMVTSFAVSNKNYTT
jgi:hypothetical protein